ncbi:hypothetical protein R6Q57_025781 [Mikania cordata]
MDQTLFEFFQPLLTSSHLQVPYTAGSPTARLLHRRPPPPPRLLHRRASSAAPSTAFSFSIEVSFSIDDLWRIERPSHLQSPSQSRICRGSERPSHLQSYAFPLFRSSPSHAGSIEGFRSRVRPPPQMETVNGEGANGSSPLSPPPPLKAIQLDVKTEQANSVNRSIISRPGFGSNGRHISLLANHFKVFVKNPDEIFFQYSVSITSEDNRTIENKILGRKILDKLYQTCSSELSGKKFAYDGEKSLYTVGALPKNKFEFMVVLEESYANCGSLANDGIHSESGKRSKKSSQEKSFKIEISYAAEIPLKSVCLAFQGSEPEKLQDALRVLDIILRQQVAQRGCLLVRQSFFHDDSRNFSDVGGGVTGCRGFYSSFSPTHGGLSLNMDVSYTVILTPGPVIDFLKSNQNARDARSIDWVKAKKLLKNLRIKTTHNNREFRINGMSEKPCHQQLFPLRVKKDNGSYDDQTINITVLDYFTKHLKIEITYSAYIPCIDVGKPKKPAYLPVELCSLISLQRYTKALSTLQRTSLIEKSRQKPQEKMQAITNAMKNYHYDDDPLLASCGISIGKQFAQVEGRVLESPKLKAGNGEEISPSNGRWSFKNKKLLNPTKIDLWAVVNFSAKCDASYISRELINCGMNKGIPFAVAKIVKTRMTENETKKEAMIKITEGGHWRVFLHGNEDLRELKHKYRTIKYEK